MSEKFDCDFLFGDSMSDVKKMDYGVLKGKEASYNGDIIKAIPDGSRMFKPDSAHT